jgi:hypothetical protein
VADRGWRGGGVTRLGVKERLNCIAVHARMIREKERESERARESVCGREGGGEGERKGGEGGGLRESA